MAYIGFRLDNENGFAGYVKIDGQNEKKIYDGLVLRVSAGMHSIKISSESAMMGAGKALLNLIDSSMGNGVPDEYAISENFQNNTLVTVDIITDGFGSLSFTPKYNTVLLTEEEVNEIEDGFKQEEKLKKETEIIEKQKIAKSNLILTIISAITFPSVIVPIVIMLVGYVKEVKFSRTYGYKPKWSTLLSLVSIIATIGGVVLMSKFIK